MPYPLAMIVCDGLWRDPYTGKTTIIGTFSTIGGRSFPLRHPHLSVYVSLTDGHGKMTIRLELVDVDEVRPPILSLSEEFDFNDPRMIFEICYFAPNIVFPSDGEYRLKLIAREEFIIERRILVVDTTRSDLE
ncbi:MAG: DUF6941 family protein [Planctomycetales bacterium]